MKGESKEKKIRKVRVSRREKRKRGNREKKAVVARLENVSEEASAVAVAIKSTLFC